MRARRALRRMGRRAVPPKAVMVEVILAGLADQLARKLIPVLVGFVKADRRKRETEALMEMD